MNPKNTDSAQEGEISAEERLALLQSLDQRRAWHSLSDRRLCVRCTKAFSGSEVQLHRRSDGSYELRCPTHGCDSTSAHWLYYGSEVHPKRAEARPLADTEIDFADW